MVRVLCDILWLLVILATELVCARAQSRSGSSAFYTRPVSYTASFSSLISVFLSRTGFQCSSPAYRGENKSRHDLCSSPRFVVCLFICLSLWANQICPFVLCNLFYQRTDLMSLSNFLLVRFVGLVMCILLEVLDSGYRFRLSDLSSMQPWSYQDFRGELQGGQVPSCSATFAS